MQIQAYKFRLENFPRPFWSLSKKLKRGNVDVLNACKYLGENGKISDDLVVIVDEMYLRKSDQYCKAVVGNHRAAAQ